MFLFFCVQAQLTFLYIIFQINVRVNENSSNFKIHRISFFCINVGNLNNSRTKLNANYTKVFQDQIFVIIGENGEKNKTIY